MINKMKHGLFLALLLAASACTVNEMEEKVEELSSNDVEPEIKSGFSGGRVGTGSFSALTYNVAGLPEILSSSNPQANTPLIGQRISAYDIVHVQEDFNYHAALYANNTHPFRTPTSGGVPFGDGLNTLSNYPYSDLVRVKWNSCNGTDCLTPKGFTFTRIRLAEGVYLDFYNAHPNAGVTNADLAARRSNISQLSQFITQYSNGNAVIVMGDFNCRYTREGDNIRTLLTANGLQDTWIQLVRNGNIPAAGSPAIVCEFPNMVNSCEVVDKIFYRSSKLVDLTPTLYQLDNPTFVTSSGQPLSDHYPVLTNFNWSLKPGFLMSDLFGGPHGTPFNNLSELTPTSKATRFSIRAGSRVDRVAVQLSNGTTLAQGGTGGTERTLQLNAGEYVREIKLNAAQHNGRTRIFYVELRTNQNRSVSGGSQSGSTVTYTAPAGYAITGFYGNAGNEIDKLGVIYTPL